MATQPGIEPVDRDVFDDPDLLDFEPPQMRQVLASRMRGGPMPATVSTARLIMFIQPVLPLVVPFIASQVRNADGEEADPAATTTTTIAAAGDQAQQQGGNAGGFLIALLAILVLMIGLPMLGMRLKRMTPSARWMALGVEALILVGAGSRAVATFAPMWLAVSGSALVVVLLLASPGTTTAIAQSNQRDSSSRFDITNLPELDR